MTTPRNKGRTGRPWLRIREQVLARDRHVCQIRGPKCTVRATHVDHITPLELGGDPHALTNLRAACAACNCAGGARMTNSRRNNHTAPRPRKQRVAHRHLLADSTQPCYCDRRST